MTYLPEPQTPNDYYLQVSRGAVAGASMWLSRSPEPSELFNCMMLWSYLWIMSTRRH
jgi:hypothetical protein